MRMLITTAWIVLLIGGLIGGLPFNLAAQQADPPPADTPADSPEGAMEDPPAATDDAAAAPSAEDAPAAAEPVEDASEEPPADTTAEPAAGATPQPGRQRAAFDGIMAKWRELLAELGTLQIEYRDADEQRRSEIRQRWQELVDQGDVMQAELIEAAAKAYAEAPNADKEITDLLVDVVMSDASSTRDAPRTDNYARAFRIGKMLIENDCENKRVYGVTGIAAFAMNDYDLAEKYRREARKSVLGKEARNLLANIPDYRKYWQREKKLREAEAAADDLPRVLLSTNKGDIEVELFENEAPNTVANFISLVEKDFYDGLTFHRVVPGFVAQGGCPKGDGTGDPGYEIPCECYRPDHRKHFLGSLSMAHSGRDTGGSQFFITFLPTPHLNGKHTVFGRVIKGFDVLTKLQRRDPGSPTAPEPDKILKAEVLRKRDHEYVPKKMGE